MSGVAGFIVVDGGLQLLDWVPAEDPAVSEGRTHQKGFLPFVESEPGVLTIRPEWSRRREVYRARKGQLAGRVFLYPGFRPVRLHKAKPPGVLRVFAFGGSSTFGLFAGKDRAFPAVLQRRLAEAFPDHSVEVINLGCSGLNSEQVSVLVDAVGDLAPDLLIVYSGHNEMLQGERPTRLWESLVGRLHRGLLELSGVYRWMNGGVERFRQWKDLEVVADDADHISAEWIPVFDPVELPPDQRRHPSPAFVDRAAQTFVASLGRMVDSARKMSVPILFVLPVANLFHPPLVSASEPGFARDGELDALLRAGRLALEQGRAAGAVGPLSRAVELSPTYARAWYLFGLAQLSLGQTGMGWAALRRSRDLDVRKHTITTRLQQSLIDTLEASGVPWVDPRPPFYREPDPAYAKTVFTDHCHPTAQGHALLTDLLLPEAIRLLQSQQEGALL